MTRVLIVDDDRETCRFMSELLEEPGRSRPRRRRTRLPRWRRRCSTSSSDINLDARLDGLDLLRAFKERIPTSRWS
ncbi:MAG: hypothetical protein U0599_15345 [Vicinamibacteria bacterium]